MTREAQNSENPKDSCKYSVEVAKQFLTMALGAVAFTIGLARVDSSPLGSVYYWAFFASVGSAVFGLLFVMGVVGHINKDSNYDVYTGGLRALGLAQILALLLAVVFLGGVVRSSIANRSAIAAETAPNLVVRAYGKELSYVVPESGKVSVDVSEGGSLSVRIGE